MIAIAAMVVGAIILGITQGGVLDKVTAAVCSIMQPGGECAPAGGGGDDVLPDIGGFGSTGEDPGDDTELPAGLDPDSPIVQELMQTARGRRILQWLHDNNIPITFDPAVTGAFHRNGTIVMGPGFDDAGTLVHEANHAEYYINNKRADINGTRDDYVTGKINEESEGVWLSVIYNKEAEAAGVSVPASREEDSYDAAYDTAYTNAIASGDSVQAARIAADAAGREAIRQMFYDGSFVTSTTGASYPDYYGQAWDNANP